MYVCILSPFLPLLPSFPPPLLLPSLPLPLLPSSPQVHPSHQYFAVGEKGTKPSIAIYSYPDLKLYRLLREGTEESYSHMDFKPNDGNLLASVGGSPDYMLTVWEWRKESVVLRSKAFSQDIYRVSFSPEMEGQLTTSGTGHIRFWKMASTFTGLKLQGQLGKFGRTELSDIEGVPSCTCNHMLYVLKCRAGM